MLSAVEYNFVIEKQLEGYGLIAVRSKSLMSCSLRVKDTGLAKRKCGNIYVKLLPAHYVRYCVGDELDEGQ